MILIVLVYRAHVLAYSAQVLACRAQVLAYRAQVLACRAQVLAYYSRSTNSRLARQGPLGIFEIFYIILETVNICQLMFIGPRGDTGGSRHLASRAQVLFCGTQVLISPGLHASTPRKNRNMQLHATPWLCGELSPPLEFHDLCILVTSTGHFSSQDSSGDFRFPLSSGVFFESGPCQDFLECPLSCVFVGEPSPLSCKRPLMTFVFRRVFESGACQDFLECPFSCVFVGEPSPLYCKRSEGVGVSRSIVGCGPMCAHSAHPP